MDLLTLLAAITGTGYLLSRPIGNWLSRYLDEDSPETAQTVAPRFQLPMRDPMRPGAHAEATRFRIRGKTGFRAKENGRTYVKHRLNGQFPVDRRRRDQFAREKYGRPAQKAA